MKKGTWFKTMGKWEAEVSHLKELIRIADESLINATDKDGRTALMLAMLARHDDDVLLSLLDRQPDIAIADSEGMTALHHAVGICSKPVISRLLDMGCDIDARTNHGETPLLLAVARSSDLAVIEMLVDAGADLLAKDDNGAGIAMHAVANKHLDVMPYLMGKGIDLTAVDDHGLNVLHHAIKNDVPVERIGRLLFLPLSTPVEKKGKVSKKKVEYQAYKATIPSAIILVSIYSSHPQAIELLLSSGADLEERDAVFGWTPLMHAVASKRQPEIVATLMAKGALVDVQDPEGMTALMLAAKYNYNSKLYELLLGSNADAAMINDEGMTAEEIARDNDDSFFGDYFNHLAYQKEVQILYGLYGDQDTKAKVSSLMERWEEDEDDWEEEKVTPLMIAAEDEPAEVVSLLIQRGADVNFVSEQGRQALVYAINNNDDIEVTKILIEAGADLDFIDDERMNLLENAILHSSCESDAAKVKMLVENGMSLEGDYGRTRKSFLESFVEMSGIGEDGEINYDYDFSDVEEHLIGSPPIILAAACTSEPEILEVLLEAGADINARDYTFGNTAVMWAIIQNVRYKRNLEVLESLIAHGADLFKEDPAGRSGWAGLFQFLDYEDLKHLLGIIPDINAKDERDFATALSVAVQLPSDASEIIKLLLGYGADLQIKYTESFSILEVAVLWDVHIKNIQALIEAGAPIITTNKFSRTPLHLSVFKLNPEVARVLLEAGADVTIKDYLDYTPLMYLIAEYTEIIEDLGGIDASIEDRTLKFIELLIMRDTRGNLQEYICSVEFWKLLNKRKRMKVDNVAFIKPFIDVGANINSKDIEDGTTPFMKACETCKDADVIKRLIEIGADVNLKDKEGNAALGFAIKGNNLKVAKLLISSGADVNDEDDLDLDEDDLDLDEDDLDLDEDDLDLDEDDLDLDEDDLDSDDTQNYTEEKLLRLAAASGDADAQCELGSLYFIGEDVSQDFVKAAKWFRMAAEQGDAVAQNSLGVLYEISEGVSQDYAKAAKFYRMAAKQGLTEAQKNLGDLYRTGSGVSQNYEEAVKWYRLAADQGHASAQEYLGLSYAVGQGVSQDYSEAAKWFRMAAEQNLADAQHFLGMLYENGDGVSQDCAEAVKWFRIAAELGNTDAQNRLGNMYWSGLDIPEDYAEAEKWFRMAAEQGHADAQEGLGLLYEFGHSVSQDDIEAAKWFRLAAEQGHASAQNRLGTFYREGRGVPKDYAEAEKWIKMAIEQGEEEAEFNLGVLYCDIGNQYEKGEGIHKNLETAITYYRQAADIGVGDALYKLGYLYENGEGVPRDIKIAIEYYNQAAEYFVEEAAEALERLGIPRQENENSIDS